MRRAVRAAAATAVAMAASVTGVVAASGPSAAAAPTYYRPADGVLHLAGHGYGHGHGMSQWGAYGGAASGADYRAILGWYYGNAAFGTANGTLKVQITSDGPNSDGTYDALIKAAPDVTAVDAAGHSLVLPATDASGTAYGAYRALLSRDGAFSVQAQSGSTWTSLAPTGAGMTPKDWSGWVRFVPRGGSNGWLTLVRSGSGNEQYREDIELDRTSGGAGVTVNLLSLEHYLAGVVSSEMPCGWTPTVNGTKRLDALEAQAVAARSYAAWRRAHPRTSQVDIVDSTSDQAYHGYSAERTALTECPWTNPDGSKTSAEAAAVAATAGQVLVDGSGAPLFAQYSASNGGFETAGGTSNLPARPDAWDGVPTESWNSHSWTDSVTAGTLSAVYPSIGTFSSVRVDSRESLHGTDQNGRSVGEQWGGRVTGLTLIGSAGSVSVSGASFAGALGLRSPWFTVVVQRPGAPTGVSASIGDGQATVSWSPPASDGGGGIRGYTITANPSVPPVSASGDARSVTVTGLDNDRSYVFSVSATNTAGSGPAASSPGVTPSAHVVFHPLPTTRILDTRSSGGAIRAGTTRSVVVTGVGGVPASGVTAVAVSVVTLDSASAGRMSVFGHGAARPPTPQLSWAKGDRVNTLVWTKVGSGGAIDLATTATTQALVDMEGYYTAATGAGDVLTATPATTVLDTRHGSPLAGGQSASVPVVGAAGVPAGATAAILQVTTVRPAQRDYLRVWGDGTPKPGAQAVFAPPRRYSDVTVVVPLGPAGSVSVAPVSTTHVIVSVVGWFATAQSPSSGVTALATPPHRVWAGTVRPHTSTVLSPGAPAGSAAALVTVTGTGPASSPISVWATGSRQPATVLHLAGTATGATTTLAVPLGTGGRIAVRNSSGASVRLWVDVAAWIAA